MNDSQNVPSFAGSIPQIYDELFVPLLFEGYARDLAARVVARRPARVLEIAAGTGVVTRELARTLPPESVLVATDLNPGMIARAQAVGTARPVEWRQADAMRLPFEAASFDAVVCQFGVMFFPDKAAAFAEARRVLRPGGALIFNVWDRLEENDVPRIVDSAIAALFPTAGPSFMERIPHGYYDRSAIAADLAHGGFDRSPEIVTLAERSRADSPRVAAMALCQGTPMRPEIEALGPGKLEEATEIGARALAARYGPGPIDGKIQAHVFTVER